MTRLLGLTVARNEADRYLSPMLAAVHEIVDQHFLYDDRSDDGTAEIAHQAGSVVVVRPEEVSSFLDNEGAFRQAAWQAFEQAFQPAHGDWVLAIDADEFLVTTDECCNRCAVDAATGRAFRLGSSSIRIPVREVFGFDHETSRPLIRTDGEWSRIAGTRVFAYLPNGVFQDKAMGCGSEPTYVARSRISPQPFGLNLIHYGYCRAEDQQAKYERYTALYNHGHSNAHIQSIIRDKTLIPWEGPVPFVPEPPQAEAA